MRPPSTTHPRCRGSCRRCETHVENPEETRACIAAANKGRRGASGRRRSLALPWWRNSSLSHWSHNLAPRSEAQPMRARVCLIAFLATLITTFTLCSGARSAPGPSAKLDQARNGTADSPTSPVDFQNGNAGSSNSHYIESQSIPYRMVLDNLSLGPHRLLIEWDVRNSGRQTIDYITSVDHLTPHDQFEPAHAPEVIDPLEGLSGSFGSPSAFPIPAPIPGLTVAGQPQPQTSFNALPAAVREMRIYNGTITALTYVDNKDGNLGD